MKGDGGVNDTMKLGGDDRTKHSSSQGLAWYFCDHAKAKQSKAKQNEKAAAFNRYSRTQEPFKLGKRVAGLLVERRVKRREFKQKPNAVNLREKGYRVSCHAKI